MRWRRRRRDADRDGRAATARGLPAIRACRRADGRSRHPRAERSLAQDLERGFLLLTDLGPTTYLRALDADNANELFRDATTRCCAGSSRRARACCRPTTKRCCGANSNLFPEWYVGRHLGQDAVAGRARRPRPGLPRSSSRPTSRSPPVYVHRDYMPRNLMVSDAEPGRAGFPGRGVRSDHLRRRIAVSRCVRELAGRARPRLDHPLLGKGAACGLPVTTDFAEFHRDCEWMGLQRHLKVLGIFARIRHRDGKAGYVEDTPRFLAYVRPSRNAIANSRRSRACSTASSSARRRSATRSDARAR